MLNVPELERQWLRYKFRSYLPGMTLIGVSIVAGVIVWWQVQVSQHSVPTAKPAVAAVASTTAEPISSAEPDESSPSLPVRQDPPKAAIVHEAAVPQKTAQVVLKPSMQFIRNMESVTAQSPAQKASSLIAESSGTPVADEKKAEPDPVKTTVSEKMAAANTSNEQKEESSGAVREEPAPKQEIMIVTKETREDLHDVISRFQKNPNPALSLFAAKKYYQMGSYEEAYNYALKTNELNPKIDESWIIFCKSLVKLGKKELAEKTLQTYIDHSRSMDAQMLLNDIRKGNVK